MQALIIVIPLENSHLDKVYSSLPTHRKMVALGRHYLLYKDTGTVFLIRKPDLTNYRFYQIIIFKFEIEISGLK